MAANSQQSPVNWDRGRKSLIFFHREEKKKMVWGRGEMSQLAATPVEKRSCVSPGSVPLPSQGSLEVLVDKKLPWGHSTLAWGSFSGLESLCTRMIPGTDGRVGKVSMGGASSFTALIGSEATTSPHVWGYSCCSAQHARTHPGGITHQDPLGKCQFSWLLQG